MTQPAPLPSYDSYVSAPNADERAHRPVVPGTNGLAVASLVLAICGVIPLLNLLAVVFAVIALIQLRYVTQQGRGLAIGALCAAGGWLLVYVTLAIVIAVRTAP